MSRLFAAGAVSMLIFLAACQSASQNVTSNRAGPFPENYADLVREHVRTTFFDPYSIRDASLSKPELGRFMFSGGWVVCLRANAKNRLGGYTGVSDTVFFVNQGRITDGGDDTVGICKNRLFTSWNPGIE